MSYSCVQIICVLIFMLCEQSPTFHFYMNTLFVAYEKAARYPHTAAEEVNVIRTGPEMSQSRFSSVERCVFTHLSLYSLRHLFIVPFNWSARFLHSLLHSPLQFPLPLPSH